MILTYVWIKFGEMKIGKVGHRFGKLLRVTSRVKYKFDKEKSIKYKYIYNIYNVLLIGWQFYLDSDEISFKIINNEKKFTI